MKTSVAITAVDRIPHPRDKTIACKFCGWGTPRWIALPAGGRSSGMWLLIEHQIHEHAGEAE